MISSQKRNQHLSCGKSVREAKTFLSIAPGTISAYEHKYANVQEIYLKWGSHLVNGAQEHSQSKEIKKL